MLDHFIHPFHWRSFINVDRLFSCECIFDKVKQLQRRKEKHLGKSVLYVLMFFSVFSLQCCVWNGWCPNQKKRKRRAGSPRRVVANHRRRRHNNDISNLHHFDSDHSWSLNDLRRFQTVNLVSSSSSDDPVSARSARPARRPRRSRYYDTPGCNDDDGDTLESGFNTAGRSDANHRGEIVPPVPSGPSVIEVASDDDDAERPRRVERARVFVRDLVSTAVERLFCTCSREGGCCRCRRHRDHTGSDIIEMPVLTTASSTTTATTTITSTRNTTVIASVHAIPRTLPPSSVPSGIPAASLPSSPPPATSTASLPVASVPLAATSRVVLPPVYSAASLPETTAPLAPPASVNNL